MRILLWYWGRRGAGGQLTLALAEALARRKDAAVALSVAARAELLPAFRELGLPLRAVRTYAGRLGFVTGLARVPEERARLVAQARDFGAECVLSVMTHLWTPLVAPGLADARLRFVPLVHDAEPHAGDPALLWRWRLGRELDAAERAIALSASVAARLRAFRPALPVQVWPLGAHLPAAALRAARQPPAEPPLFVLFGRLLPYKGLDLLRDAFAVLRRTRPDARLLVVGQGDHKTLAPGLAGLPGVRVEARWVAEAEIAPLLAPATAVVLPYREASQSGIVPLAAALGVPAIVTPVGALAEQVTDGVDGLVAEAVTADALASSMARVCDPALRITLAAGAARRGARLADWDAQAAELLRLLRTPVPAHERRRRYAKA